MNTVAALEGHIYLYQSIEYHQDRVFKNQGQVPVDRLGFWKSHYEQFGRKVITSPLYVGDRVYQDLTPFVA